MYSHHLTSNLWANGPERTSSLLKRYSPKQLDQLGFQELRKGWRARDHNHVGSRAVLAGGLISCVDALDIYNVWVPSRARENLHVRIERGQRRRNPRYLKGIRIHQPLLSPPQVESYLRTPRVPWLDSISNSLYCSIRCQPLEISIAILDSILHQRIIWDQDLQRILDLLPRKFRGLLAQCDPHAESGLESIPRVLLRKAGYHVEVQAYIRGVGRVDLLINGVLVLESDGRKYHDTVDQFNEDRRRAAELARQGYLSLHFTYHQIMHQPELVLEAVEQTLQRVRPE